MATPPSSGWDGEHSAVHGHKADAERRTGWANDAGYESWGAWVEAVEEESHFGSICGRPNRDREPCGQAEAWGVDGHRGACRKHGGNNLKGRAHPNYTDGRKSKYAPKGLIDYQDEALRNPDALSVLREIGTLRYRLATLYDDLGREGASAETLELVTKARAMLDEAMSQSDPDKLRATLRLLSEAEDASTAGRETWAEIRSTIDLLRRVVKVEVDRQKVAHDMITRDRLVGFTMWLIDRTSQGIEEIVTDSEERKQLLQHFAETAGMLSAGPAVEVEAHEEA